MCKYTDEVRELQYKLKDTKGVEAEKIRNKITNLLLDLYLDKINTVNMSLDKMEAVLDKYGGDIYVGDRRSNH